MKKIKVKRSSQITYRLLPERFCTYCGAKGIYEDDVEDYYSGNGEFCFHCGENRPMGIRDQTTLPRFLANEPTVIDRIEWESEVTEFEHLFENHMRNVAAMMVEDALKPVPNVTWDGGIIPIVYGPKRDE